jgi:hypothetical protein
MAKILKNTTLSDMELSELGKTIPASGQITIPVQEYILLASDDSIAECTAPITNGDIVVNDGTVDLSASDGLNYIRYPDDSRNINFNNTGTGMTSTNIRDAIIEANNGTGGPDNFSYKRIGLGETVTIPEDQQMLVFKEICLEDDGEVCIDEELIVLE